MASQPALPAAVVSAPGGAPTLAAARVLKRSPSRAKSADWPLALPLAALFIACFVAPLMVLIGVSAYAEPAMRTLSFAQYTKFCLINNSPLNIAAR